MDKPATRELATCPVRVGEECRLCVPGASGPHDCGLAYLVTTDPGLREELLELMRSRDAESDDGDESTP